MKIDVLHRGEAIVTAKLNGRPWGAAELDETLGWKITTVETDLPIREIKSRCRVSGSFLEVLPEAEWRETIIAKQVALAEVEAQIRDGIDEEGSIINKAVDAILRGDLTFDGDTPVIIDRRVL